MSRNRGGNSVTVTMGVGKPRQLSIKEEAREIAAKKGVTLFEATEEALARRREEASRVATAAKARKLAANIGVKLALDSKEVGLIAERNAKAEEFAKQRREELTKLIALRADMFATFVIILEKKGLPAHVIDEQVFAAAVVDGRWDVIPAVLAHLIGNDDEVKSAYQAFADVAMAVKKNVRNDYARAFEPAKKLIFERYRETFLHAASAYARKLSHLESSLDRLDVLPADELQKLVDDGDELSKRVADLSLRIADELKRREAKSAGDKSNAGFRSMRAKVYVWLIDQYQGYKDRKALDEAATEIEKHGIVVGRSWRKIREDITEYGKLNSEEIQQFIAENLQLRTTGAE